jgi:hypothetical protein
MITNVRSYSETRVIQNRCNGEEEGGSREESCLQERVTCVTRSVTLLQLIICLTDSHLGVPDPIGLTITTVFGKRLRADLSQKVGK